MSNPPGNWYPDPHDASQLRYWDGQQWTEHRAPVQQAAQPSQTGDAAPATASGPVEPKPEAGQTKSQTKVPLFGAATWRDSKRKSWSVCAPKWLGWVSLTSSS